MDYSKRESKQREKVLNEDKCLCCGKCCTTPDGVRCIHLSNTNRCNIYNNRLMFRVSKNYFCGLRSEQKRFIEGCPFN